VSKLLEVSNLSIGYQKPLQENLNFSISDGEILLINGRNGAGKSTLIKTLCHEKKPLKGNIKWELSKKEFAVLPQLVSHEFPISITLGDILQTFELSQDVQDIFSTELKERRFNDASGGEKQKTLILTRLRKSTKLLILDEPFNHMDKNAISEIMDFLSLLMDKKVIRGIILISHASVEFKKYLFTKVELS
jgi:ABC-type Mn2+/Zn2+ transport system ATPase subunit